MKKITIILFTIIADLIRNSQKIPLNRRGVLHTPNYNRAYANRAYAIRPYKILLYFKRLRVKPAMTVRLSAMTVGLYLILAIVSSITVSAQNYEFTLHPRRAYDQIQIEIWAKALNTNAPRLGSSSLVIQYNTSFFAPSVQQNLLRTDTLKTIEANSPQPIDTIITEFHNANGYSALLAGSYGNGFYSLEINHTELGVGGLQLKTDGRGSFIGIITLNIIGNPTATDLANIQWSKATQYGTVEVFDAAGNNIKSQIRFIDAPANYTVIGVTLLSPNKPNMVIDRDAIYRFLTGDFNDGGYPIYFERSINPNIYKVPTAQARNIDENLAYLLEYSLNGGNTWTEIGRVAETDKTVSASNSSKAFLKSGEIFEPRPASYFITTQTGTQLNQNTFRQPLRIIWTKDQYFLFRSENARLRITILNEDSKTTIATRTPSNIRHANNFAIILGRLFFAQLNGINQYFKTDANYSNATQLTVAAWINMNDWQAGGNNNAGNEPAIIASAGGPGTGVIYTGDVSSTEGAWMLYLKNGNIPAFRVREILGRGDSTVAIANPKLYLAVCEAYPLDRLVSINATVLTDAHADNWVHLAATVADNTASLYVNGELASRVTNTNANNIRMLTTNHPIWVGANPNNIVNNVIPVGSFLAAGIKGVQVWRTALTQDEIRKYAAGIPQPDSISNAATDIKRALEMYWTLEGTNADAATNAQHQAGRQDLYFYNDAMANLLNPPSSGVIGNGYTGQLQIQNSKLKIQNCVHTENNTETVGARSARPYNNSETVGARSARPYNNCETVGARSARPYNNCETLDILAEYLYNNSEYNQKTVETPHLMGGIPPHWEKYHLTERNTTQNRRNTTSLGEIPPEKGEIPPHWEKYHLTERNTTRQGEISLKQVVNDGKGEQTSPLQNDTTTVGAGSARPTTDINHSEGHIHSEGRMQYAPTNPQLNDRRGVLLMPNNDSINHLPLTIYHYKQSDEFQASPVPPIYRPDQPHLTVTAPARGSGIMNKQGDNTEVRWITYGMLDIYRPTRMNFDVEYRIVGQEHWTLARNPSNQNLTGNNITVSQIDNGSVQWQPFLNNTPVDANLRTINPYAKQVQIRLRGIASNGTTGLISYSDTFTVAPHFALSMREGSQLRVLPRMGMNITNNAAYIEAWIKPYRLPTVAEGFFPIVQKSNGVTGAQIHYSLRLNSNGTLSFIVGNTNNVNHTVSTTTDLVVQNPNSMQADSAWTHIAVLFIRNNNNEVSEARFYIDGIVQAREYPSAISLNTLNTFPLFIGSNNNYTNSFVGEIKEVRFWNNVPNNIAVMSNPIQNSKFKIQNDDSINNFEFLILNFELDSINHYKQSDEFQSSSLQNCPFTLFVQKSQSEIIKDIRNQFKGNLHSFFTLEGGTFIIDGNNRVVAKSDLNGALLQSYGTPVRFNPFVPFIKLVEPVFNQSVCNTDTNVKVRWVGLHYDGLDFTAGSGSGNRTPPSLEWSILGGGGTVTQPYQFVGSLFFAGNTRNSIRLLQTDEFYSNLSNSNKFVALSLNAAMANPSVIAGNFSTQGKFSPTLTNGRFRLSGSYSINGEKGQLRSEGPLFTITPESNFTLRIMLEGYHQGNTSGRIINNLGTVYEQGGLRITLFSNNSGEIGHQVGQSAHSIYGYTERDPANLNRGNNRFGNVDFVFTDVANGLYWVLVEHINHLPIMSRYPAQFLFTGDNPTTWAIESGWDFMSWNGVDFNTMPSPSIDSIWHRRYFTARGAAVNMSTHHPDLYAITGLIFNGGNTSSTGLAGMVGGDVNQDGQINAADRVKVRQETGTTSYESDVTGDRFVNALDRTIVDKNFGKISSLFNVKYTQSMVNDEWLMVNDGFSSTVFANEVKQTTNNKNGLPRFARNDGSGNNNNNSVNPLISVISDSDKVKNIKNLYENKQIFM